MKVAILCPGFGWDRRGTERVTEEIVSRLSADYKPIVYSLCLNHTAKESSWLTQRGGRLRRVPAIPRTHFLARCYSPLARRAGVYLWSPGDFEAMTFATNLLPWLLYDKPDVVLSFAGPSSGRVCRILRALRGTPFLHSAQGMAQGRLEWIHARQRPNRYLATSVPNRQWIEARAPWLTTHLVPNGVDCSRFCPDGEIAALPLKPPVILFVGAIDPVKRPDLTIRAVARLNADCAGNGGGASLLMIGDGRIRPQIERMGLQVLGDRFLLVPSIENQNLPAYYRASSVFTLATAAEPFGIVFLEAMACNVPVVAHEGPVQGWLLEGGGVCCDCENEHEYAAALKAALKKDFGARPRERALEFDWNIIIREYETVFSELKRGANGSGTSFS